MSLIRRLEPTDLPAVHGLMDGAFPITRHGAQYAAADFIADMVLGSPWADPEIGPLVALEDERIVGFLAVHSRRVRFEDRTLRAICCSHLVVDEHHRGGAAGALLLGRALQGPQDLAISDTAIDVVARVWTTFGGTVDTARSLEWMQILRPGRLAAGLARPWAGGVRPDVTDLPVPGLPLQAAARFLPRLRPQPDPAVAREPLTPELALAEMPAVAKGLRLRADYDEAYLGWLFERVRGVPGELVVQLVRHGRRAVGWYAYVLRPSGTARVLQVLASPRHSEAVLGDLLADATARGAALVAGRVEPHLHEPLRRRRTSVGFGERHVVHSRDPAVLAAYGASTAVVSRLDGEWW